MNNTTKYIETNKPNPELSADEYQDRVKQLVIPAVPKSPDVNGNDNPLDNLRLPVPHQKVEPVITDPAVVLHLPDNYHPKDAPKPATPTPDQVLRIPPDA